MEKYVYLDASLPTASFYPGHIDAGDVILFKIDIARQLHIFCILSSTLNTFISQYLPVLLAFLLSLALLLIE